MLQNSFLVNILKSFSTQEWKDFNRFINSPYFNTNKQLVKFFSLIERYLKKEDTSKLEKIILFKLIYTGKKYEDNLMRKLISLANKLTEQFLATERTLRNSLEMKRKFIYELSERNITNGLDKHFHLCESLILGKKMTEEIYLEKYLTDCIYSQIKSQGNVMNTSPHKPQIKSLVNYFSFSYAKITVYNLIREILTGDKFEKPLFNELDNMNSAGYFDNDMPVKIFLEIARLFTFSEENKFEQFKKVDLIEFEKFLNSEDCTYAYFYISQYLIIEGMRGVGLPRHSELKWKYYQKYAEHIVRSGVGETVFTSIVNGALANRQFEWAESFIGRNIKNLISYDKDSFVNSLLARIKIADKKFNDAIVILSKSSPRKNELKDDLKRYHIIILYELSKFEELYSLINSYKKFLSNASVNYPGLFIFESKRFIQAVEMLLKIRFSENRNKKENAELAFAKLLNKKIIKQAWLKEKYEELKELQ